MWNSRSPKRRSRSRSRDRDRRGAGNSRYRSRSRSAERVYRSPPRGDREYRRRERERSRSPRRFRSRSRSRSRGRDRFRDERRKERRSLSRERPRVYPVRQYEERPPVQEKDLVGKSEEEVEMLKTMGFCGFDTSKNKKVDGNNVGAVNVILKRKYRQYMNRKGGFNRPLDFVA